MVNPKALWLSEGSLLDRIRQILWLQPYSKRIHMVRKLLIPPPNKILLSWNPSRSSNQHAHDFLHRQNRLSNSTALSHATSSKRVPELLDDATAPAHHQQHAIDHDERKQLPRVPKATYHHTDTSQWGKINFKRTQLVCNKTARPHKNWGWSG